MKKILIYILVIVLGALIMFIILGDFMSNDIEDSSANPYAYKVDDYKAVDASWLKYAEIKRVSLNIPDPKSIDIHEAYIGLGYKNHLQVIDTTGFEIFSKTVQSPVSALSFSTEGNIFLGCYNFIEIFNIGGDVIGKWTSFDEDAIITSIAFRESDVFVADAGNKTVYRFNKNGEVLSSFDGTGRLEGDYGFIIPSPYFDLEIDADNQLWVANPGLLNVENYSDEGTLRAFWGKPSFDIDGFTGCCNPAHFAILSDGSFVTSEKGIPRIKVYKASGELESVVAAPEAFSEDNEPSDVAVDDKGRIYALDINEKKIRIFEKNK